MKLRRHPRGAVIACAGSGLVFDGNLPVIPPRQRSPEFEHQLSGRRAWQEGGVCGLCPDPILKDERITPHGAGWIHVRCAPGQDDAA